MPDKLTPEQLAVRRAQAYPRLVDDYGRNWDDDRIAALQDENTALRQLVREMGLQLENVKQTELQAALDGKEKP